MFSPCLLSYLARSVSVISALVPRECLNFSTKQLVIAYNQRALRYFDGEYFVPVTMMKYLNVAEKNAAAKSIAILLSGRTYSWEEGHSLYNKLYKFEAEVNGEMCEMVMTSVSGHLMKYDFIEGRHINWDTRYTEELFGAPVSKNMIEKCVDIRQTLEEQVEDCQGLIIWTDGDREGENIGYEIMDVCTNVNDNLTVYRARFSEITALSVERALANLQQPNQNISDAVDTRQEIDLKIGAAFTRFQTLHLRESFPIQIPFDRVVSFGTCQFPTLGFVVGRYKQIEDFEPQRFWKIKVNHTENNISVDYAWEREHLFNQEVCQSLFDTCRSTPVARVREIRIALKIKERPLPLNTVELEKQVSRILNINAKETMAVVERLYLSGGISYPRTDTNVFPESLDLVDLVREQQQDPDWGSFATRILCRPEGPTPRQGNKYDEAHPPIYPTTYISGLSGNAKIIYEFIVRSFLACCFKDAKGIETVVTIDVAGEKFEADGLEITERNYLDVYDVYGQWSPKNIHDYELDQTFEPHIEMEESETSPPDLLSEADLIELMDENGIGTDATHLQHIETIKTRSYVTYEDSKMEPTSLGIGLVEGYDAMGLNLSRPHLRRQLEVDLQAICDGTKRKDVVLQEQISQYRERFETASARANVLDRAIRARFEQEIDL